MPLSPKSLQAENTRIQALEFTRLKKNEQIEFENANFELRRNKYIERQKCAEEAKTALQKSNVRIQLAELRNRIS
jgi:hypothetical protein